MLLDASLVVLISWPVKRCRCSTWTWFFILLQTTNIFVKKQTWFSTIRNGVRLVSLPVLPWWEVGVWHQQTSDLAIFWPDWLNGHLLYLITIPGTRNVIFYKSCQTILFYSFSSWTTILTEYPDIFKTTNWLNFLNWKVSMKICIV